MGIGVETKHPCAKYPHFIFCGVLQLFAAGLSRAAEWSAEPSVTLRGDYNDNIHLTTEPHARVSGVILSPEVKLSGESETLKMTGGLRLNFNRYYGERGLDTDDHTLTLRSRYRSERDVVGFNLDSISDSTLISELATTGVVQSRRQRNLLTANPSWSRSVTENSAIVASYGYTAVKYADTSGTTLIDYSDQIASLSLQSALDQRNSLRMTAYHDRFETDPASFRAKTYGVEAGLDHDFSETLHGSLALGLRRTQSTITSQALVCTGPIFFGICFGTVTALASVRKESTSGYTLNAALEKRWETRAINGRFSREVNPSGLGSLIQTDRLGIGWTRQLSAVHTAYLDAAAYRSRYIGGVVTGSNSRYYRTEARLSWRVTERWTVDGGYGYARQKYDNASTAAAANVVYVMLSYAWPKLTASR